MRRVIMGSSNNEWEQIYRNYPLSEMGWELGKPRPILREYVEKGLIKKGKAPGYLLWSGNEHGLPCRERV